MVDAGTLAATNAHSHLYTDMVMGDPIAYTDTAAEATLMILASVLGFTATVLVLNVAFDSATTLESSPMTVPCMGLYAAAGVCGVISFAIIDGDTDVYNRRNRELAEQGTDSQYKYNVERGAYILFAGSLVMLVIGGGYCAYELITNNRRQGRGYSQTKQVPIQMRTFA